ncbi:hypothetical protein DFH09DRAFT_1365225 [Mycena vulgaris]|nr:hypothetical protein DFH09DRAFT_1365225 [Mycena vulgaris]
MLRVATRLARRPHNAPAVALSRPSSSTAHHDEHHHDHPEQMDVDYPKEGFTGPIWRKTLACAIGAALFYEYLGAPADNDLPWLPATSVEATESWTDIASVRAAKEAVISEGRQLVRSAERPPIYRSRNPENFNHISPYGNPVGMGVQWNKPE